MKFHTEPHIHSKSTSEILQKSTVLVEVTVAPFSTHEVDAYAAAHGTNEDEQPVNREALLERGTL